MNDRGVMRVEPAELVNAPDGLYELRYVFEGRPEAKSVRIDRGDILGNYRIPFSSNVNGSGIPAAYSVTPN
ncbi:MAG: hypothetical protein ROO76_14365 [Terriglobia bacterium]|nr:hypothetical protein [Terriglobia bacterium]